MKTVIVIPARIGSTRLPGKPLLAETGKPLIQHVYENAARTENVSDVIVATDDDAIMAAVNSFGGSAVMTSPNHQSGSERIAEAVQNIDCDIVVNLQGDEPEIPASDIKALIDIQSSGGLFASTLACPISASDKALPSCVKVVMTQPNPQGLRQALYFSRSAIPHDLDTKAPSLAPSYLHIGIYAYSRENLLRFAQMGVSPLENHERLEQLRILENGYHMGIHLIDAAYPGIDTPEDYASFVKRFKG